MLKRIPLPKDDRLFIFLVMVVNLAVIALPFRWLLQPFMSPALAEEMGHVPQCLILFFWSVWVIRKRGIQHTAGIRLFRLHHPQYLVIPFLFPIVLAIPSWLDLDTAVLLQPSTLAIMAVWLMQGISEELVFRGIIQGTFIAARPAGNVYRPVLLSALVFAVMHLVNLRHMNPLDVGNQIISAFFLGIMLGAIQMKVNNVWWLGLVHGFVNIAFGAEELVGIKHTRIIYTLQEMLATTLKLTLVFSPALVIGLLILRSEQKKKKRQAEREAPVAGVMLT